MVLPMTPEIKRKLTYSTIGHIFAILNLYALSKESFSAGVTAALIATFFYIRALLIKVK